MIGIETDDAQFPLKSPVAALRMPRYIAAAPLPHLQCWEVFLLGVVARWHLPLLPTLKMGAGGSELQL